MDGTSICCPAAAVPVTVKMPPPMTAPIPNAIRLHGPKVRFSRFPSVCDSFTISSMFLVHHSWFIV